MKKLLYLAAALSLPALTHAQDGFYLSASGGAGMSNATRSEVPGLMSEEKTFITNYNAGLTAGYQLNRWRFQTGVQYMTSGYKYDLVFSTDYDPLTGKVNPSGDVRLTFRHIGIPVQVAYALPIGKKLNLVPSLGLLATYNMNLQSRTRYNNGTRENTQTLSGDDFTALFNRVSLWGTAALHVEYKLSDRVSLFGGPSANYMITNLAKQIDMPHVPELSNISQRNYSFGLELGVKLNL